MTDLEGELDAFSFEELGAKDAKNLKKSFSLFKSDLASHVNPTDSVDLIKSTNRMLAKIEDAKMHNSSDFANYLIQLGQLIQNMSTELNGIIELVESEATSFKSTNLIERDFLVQSKSKRLINQLDDLLEYSQISLGTSLSKSVEFDFIGVMKSIFYLTNTLRVSDSIGLVVHLDKNIPSPICGDPTRLTQILLGLLNLEMDLKEGDEMHLHIKNRKETSSTNFIEFSLEHVPNGNKNKVFDYSEVTNIQDVFKLELIKETIKSIGGNILIYNGKDSFIRYEFEIPFLKPETEILRLNEKWSKKNNTMKTSLNMDSNYGDERVITIDTKIKSDLSALLKECMGDLDYLQELVRLYKQNAVEFIGAVSLHIQNVDLRQIKLAAHKIKCGLAMMGTEHLGEIVHHIHELCTIPENISIIENLKNCFVTEYLIVEESIDDALQKMKKK